MTEVSGVRLTINGMISVTLSLLCKHLLGEEWAILYVIFALIGATLIVGGTIRILKST